MAISIDGVVYSVSANTSKFEESMKKVENLEKKIADLTDKNNERKLKAAVEIENAEKRLAKSREQFTALQNATSKEEISQRKQIEREINTQEKALKRLQDRQVIAEADYQRALTKTQKELKKVQFEIGKYDKTLNTLSKGFSKVTLPLAAIAGTSLYAWGQQEEALQRMESALVNSGLSVEQYSVKFQELASNIQKFTVVGDETILKNQQLALSMGVSAENMEWVQRGAVALQEALGINLTEATKKLAGALQGNMKPFNELIPEMRNASTESEKLAILNQKLSDYWQVAKEKADTFNGALQQAKNAIGDAGEEIGKVLAPAIISLAKSVKGLAEWFNGLSDVSKALIVAVASTAATLPILAKSIVLVKSALIAYKAAMAGATLATKLFSASLVKTGIGAALVFVGYALAYLLPKLDEYVDKGKEFQDSSKESSEKTEEFNAKLQASKVAAEEAAKALESQKNALVAYHKALDELMQLQDEHTFKNLSEVEQLRVLQSQYQMLQNKIGTLNVELLNDNLTIEERAYLQEQLVAATKELYSTEDRIKTLREGINRQLDEQNKKLEDNRKKREEVAKKSDEAARREQEAVRREQEAAQAEREQILQSRENYEYELKLRLLESQGNTELADKLKMEQRVAELMKEQGYSREQAYKFAKLEKELKGGKQVEYSEKDNEKAKKIVERGEGGSVGKKTFEQAQAILAGKKIEGDEVAVFSGANERSKASPLSRLTAKGIDSLGRNGEAINAEMSTQTGARGKQVEKGGGASNDVASKLDEILTAINERIPETLRTIFAE